MKRRITFVEQYYYPEGWGGAQLPRDLTVCLHDQGYCIDVICGSEAYVEEGKLAGIDPASIGIKVKRVPRLWPGDPRKWRLLRHLWFYAFATCRLMFGRRPDLFIVQTNPPLIVVISAFVSLVRRKPMMVIAQDLYPEALAAVATSRLTRSLVRLLERPFNWAYRRANAIVSLGEAMTRRLHEKGVSPARIVVISNWATGSLKPVQREANTLVDTWGTRGRTVFIYSGNMGIGHEFDTLLESLGLASRTQPGIVMLFVGRGARLRQVKSYSAEHQLADTIRLHDFVPSDKLNESLGIADLAVVTLQPGFAGLSVPSKMLGYMARGIPVLYIGPPGDVDQLIARAGCGYSYRNGDVSGVSQLLMRVATGSEQIAVRGENGRDYYEANLSRERALSAYSALVAQCVG